MKKHTVISAITAAALTGSAIWAVPALAGNETETTSAAEPTGDKAPGNDEDRRAGFVERVRENLQELVDKDTITTDQADAVAETLATKAAERDPGKGKGRGHHGPGMGFHDDIAEALGLTQEQVQEGFEAGKSLAEIAEEHGISRDDATAKLITAGAAKIDAAVEEGKLTTEKAAEMKEKLPERVEKMLDMTPGTKGDRPRRGGQPGEGRPSGDNADNNDGGDTQES